MRSSETSRVKIQLFFSLSERDRVRRSYNTHRLVQSPTDSLTNAHPDRMASKVPKASGGVAVKHLIVDSSPLLTAPLSSLRGIATNYLVTPDVVMELRDKNGRNVLDEANLQLPADTTVSPSHHGANDDDDNDDEMKRTHEGFQVREPTAESIAKSEYPSLSFPPAHSMLTLRSGKQLRRLRERRETLPSCRRPTFESSRCASRSSSKRTEPGA